MSFAMEENAEAASAVLLALWASERPPYERVVTHGEAEVLALEARLEITIPPAFRHYILAACSTHDDGGELDASCNAWWGLDRIDSVSNAYEHELGDAVLTREASTSLVFADHMVWCMAWAICCRPGPNYGRVFVINSPARFVADDFATFADQYAREPQDLL